MPRTTQPTGAAPPAGAASRRAPIAPPPASIAAALALAGTLISTPTPAVPGPLTIVVAAIAAVAVGLDMARLHLWRTDRRAGATTP